MTSLLKNIFKKEASKPNQKKPKKTSQADLSSKKTEPKLHSSNKEELVRVYQVLTEPHITEKATDLIDQNKYVFKVKRGVNKIEIKKAVEKLYHVKVDKINITHIAAKRRRLGRFQGWRQGLKKGSKKAIVTLKPGQKIEIMPR